MVVPLFWRIEMEGIVAKIWNIKEGTMGRGAAIDAAVVAKYCDGAIIVIGQGMASARMIQSVKKQLEASGVRILGAVLNKVNNKKSSHVSGYYGNYYGSYYGKSDKS